MIKAIAFDFDHTLYDRDATYENLVDDFMAYFADELQEGISRERVLKVMQDCDRTGIYKDHHWEGIYRDTLASGIFRKNPTYQKYYHEFLEDNYPAAIVLYKDTISALEELRRRGYKVGILTNGPSEYQHMKVNRVHLPEHVDCVVVGGDLPHQKPHKYAFEVVCEKMGCALEEAAYVGDNPINDMDGARQAGLTPIWIRSVDIWLDAVEPVEHSIVALGELPDLLDSINAKQ